MIKKEENVNPNLKFILSNNAVVNIILLISTFGIINLSIIAAINGWFGK